ncbi:MAG: hypothetical protein Fur0018_03270 [Anaerolineales bacterium]
MFKKFFILFAVMAVFALALTACGGQATPEPTKAPTAQPATATKAPEPTSAPAAVVGDAAAGEALFNQDTIGSAPGCKACHSLEPNTVIVGPSLYGMADDAAADAPDNPEGFLRETIVDPNADVASGFQPNIMYPNYGSDLSEQQIADLVAFMMTLKESGEASVAPEGNPLRGGQLYDNWWKTAGVDLPAGDQPLWATQDSNKRSGGDTWRCKECHGWDYRGVDGVYGSGSHKTGFAGVFNLVGGDPNEVIAALKGETNPDHNFAQYMSEQDVIDLALFITHGVYDTSAIVNADKTPVNGDAAAGETAWAVCAACHGPQGLAINFKDENKPEYASTIAQDNPWEFLHKAHFGQPATPEMPAGATLGWSDQDFANIVAYLQQQPASSPVTEGGLLYDKWWIALSMDAPEGDMPLWATQTTNTRSGTDTWRCKECHGWDYKGVDGAYGSGSHMTGFAGIFAAKDKSAEEIIAAMTGQVNPDHDFSQYFNEEQLNMVVAFIQQLPDISEYVNTDKTVNGDADHGQKLYRATCARCHGQDGTEIMFGDESNPEFVGTIAADNPWEFFNKASFGQPGEHMPSGLNMGWTWQDIADLAAYAQTLPTSK